MRYTKTNIVICEKTLEASGSENYLTSQIGRRVTARLLRAKSIIYTVSNPRAIRIGGKGPEIGRSGIEYCIEHLRRVADLNRANVIVVEKVIQIHLHLILMSRSRSLSKFPH